MGRIYAICQLDSTTWASQEQGSLQALQFTFTRFWQTRFSKVTHIYPISHPAEQVRVEGLDGGRSSRSQSWDLSSQPVVL